MHKADLYYRQGKQAFADGKPRVVPKSVPTPQRRDLWLIGWDTAKRLADEAAHPTLLPHRGPQWTSSDTNTRA